MGIRGQGPWEEREEIEPQRQPPDLGELPGWLPKESGDLTLPWTYRMTLEKSEAIRWERPLGHQVLPPHFTDEETEAQRGKGVTQGHTASKSGSLISVTEQIPGEGYLELSEVKGLAQAHTAGMCRRQDLNPGPMDSETRFLLTTTCFLFHGK